MLARDINEPAFYYHLQHFLEDQLELDAASSPFIYILDQVYVYCCCHIPHTWQFMQDRWYVLQTYPCCYFLEVWLTTI